MLIYSDTVNDEDSSVVTNERDVEYTEVVHPQPVEPSRGAHSRPLLSACSLPIVCFDKTLFLTLMLSLSDRHAHKNICPCFAHIPSRLIVPENQHILGGALNY